MKRIQKYMNKKILTAILFSMSLLPIEAAAVSIADYTAFPPFLPRIVSPNILFLMDYSKNMVKPAYGSCFDYGDKDGDGHDNDCRTTFVDPYDDYDSSQEYYGYFEPTKRYNCTTGASGQCEIAAAGAWSGNFLNWLAILQFDVVKKVVIGGDLSPAPEGNPTPNTLKSIVGNSDIVNIYKVVSETNRSGNAPAFSSTAVQEIPYDWIDTPAGNTPLASGNNAGWIGEIDFPFDFKLFTQSFSAGSKLAINVNGWVAFKASASSKATNVDMPDTDTSHSYDYMMAPLWTNQKLVADYSLDPDVLSEIQYFIKGTAPNRVAVITFKDVVDEVYDGASDPVCTAPQTLCGDKSQCALAESVACTANDQCCSGNCDGVTSPTCSSPETLCIDNTCGKPEGESAAAVSECCGTTVVEDVPVCTDIDSDFVTCQDKANKPCGYADDHVCAIDADCCGECKITGKATTGTCWKATSAPVTAYPKVCGPDDGTAPVQSGTCTADTGTAPDSETANDDPYTYQVLLFEGSNQIIFQYKEVRESKPWGKGLHATVGVQGDASAGEAKKYSHETASLRNSLALLMTPGSVLYKVTTGATTRFNEAAYTDGTNPAYHPVEIAINSFKRASSNVDCPAATPYKILVSGGESNKLTCLDHNPSGLMQEFRALEDSGTIGFRLSFMTIAGDTGTDGAAIDSNKGTYFNEGLGSNMMNALRSATPTTEAPLAEGLYEAMQYFRQEDNIWGNKDFTNQNGDSDATACTGSNPTDPYCFESAEIKVECCKSYVLAISSGEYSHDFTKNIYGDADNAESVANTPPTRCKSTLDNGACTAASEATVANGGWLDDVAYYAHVTDLRPTDLGGMQNLNIYTVNTFGGFSGSGGYNREGAHVLKQAAMYGGFEDIDADGELDAGEWDKNADGIPDTYFEATGGSNLKATIMAAVMQILKSSASGTSVSVLSTSAGGQGAIYQAYFFPSKLEGEADDRVWPGYMRSFFIDRYQNLRDDASGGTYTTAADGSTTYSGTQDARLKVANISDDGDYVATMHLDDEYQVRVRLVEDDDGLDVSLTADKDPHIDDVVSLWEAGKELALKTKSTRRIYVWIDEDYDGMVDDGDFTTDGPELMAFDASNRDDLVELLRAKDPDNPPYTNYTGALTAEDEAEDIIDFVRGEYVTGYRNRCITVDGSTREDNGDSRRSNCEFAEQRVWPLGDIIYSTPTLVSGPSEKYDEIYGEASYRPFRAKYRKRRNMIYVGANDGMLHAFNAGFFEAEETKFCTGNDADNSGRIEGDMGAGGECAAGTYKLGEEMWGFIPHDNLPHLAWLACNGTASDPTACGASEYTHVYYVDERPKVSDVKIFTDDATHPGGWGTILIMGMRYGGGAMDLTFANSTSVREFRSAYYMFDITDPEVLPKLLGRYSHDSLGFTLSYPAIARVEESGGSEKWFAVFGSGPENLTGTAGRDYKSNSTTQNGSIHVVEIREDGMGGGNSKIFDTGHASSIMGDPAVVDVDLDFSADVIYIGSSFATTDGKIYRLNIDKDLDPANWVKSELFSDADMGPLLVPPSASMDTAGNFWVYFGTGRLRSKDDMTNRDQQRFYAIKDDCWRNLTAGSGCTAAGGTFVIGDLFPANDAVIKPTTGASDQVSSTEACGGTCSYQELINYVQTKKGWYVNLAIGATDPSERVLARSAVLGGLLLFTTYTPLNDVCSVFGKSNLYALYYETGTAYDKTVFEGVDAAGEDINKDEIQKSLDLGAGMPTAVGIAVGETVTGFVQKSTGEIVRIRAAPGIGSKSGKSSWREKVKGGGTVEIEETYKHIVQ